jgi:hypothetical protein
MKKEERGEVPDQQDGRAVFVFLVSSSLHCSICADDPDAHAGLKTYRLNALISSPGI